MTRFLPLLIFLVLAALLALALLQKPGHDIVMLSGNEMHEKLPTLKLATRDGKKQVLNLEGKVTLINFFASWCTPCIEDHRELLELSRTHPELSLQGIAWNDTVSRIEDWLTQHRNPFVQVWFDDKGKASIALGVRGMPESFIVDKRGFIRYHIPGPLNEKLRKRVIAPLIEKLAEEA